MKVGYLGPSGSFTHNVAVKAFPEANRIPFANITEVIKSYKEGFVDYAIIPVENSIEGSVHETLDYLFHQAEIEAIAEIIQPIKQQLLATTQTKKIEKIFYTPASYCSREKTTLKHIIQQQKLEMTASTAYAARFIAEHPEENFAAIAPVAAAKEYGLEIIAQDIQEMDENYTRFWVLGHQKRSFDWAKLNQKVSLALTLPDNLPGALYKALSVFAWRGIDLTKIESRPLKTALGEYFFIVDVENKNDTLVSFALEELNVLGIDYKILGRYDVYKL